MVLLSQNQQVRIDFLGYMRYEALAKYIKLFKKTLRTSSTSVPGLIQKYYFHLQTFIFSFKNLIHSKIHFHSKTLFSVNEFYVHTCRHGRAVTCRMISTKKNMRIAVHVSCRLEEEFLNNSN